MVKWNSAKLTGKSLLVFFCCRSVMLCLVYGHSLRTKNVTSFCKILIYSIHNYDWYCFVYVQYVKEFLIMYSLEISVHAVCDSGTWCICHYPSNSLAFQCAIIQNCTVFFPHIYIAGEIELSSIRGSSDFLEWPPSDFCSFKKCTENLPLCQNN